jgi:AcrR family transcriptional regulator
MYQRQQRIASGILGLSMESSNPPLRTPAAILATAAHLLAERRDASMNDIAAAAGVGRATLYRYFPTREALMQALADDALQDLAARLGDARLDKVPVPEALQRVFRAVLTVGDRYVLLLDERTTLDRLNGRDEALQVVGTPIVSVFQRGQDDGTLRDDLDAAVLGQLFGGLVVAAIDASLPRTLGVEQAAALCGSIFLDGVRRRRHTSRR